MGKAAKLKQLRRLARQLPAVQVKKTLHDYVPGHEVAKIAEVDSNFVAINPKKMYHRTQQVMVDENHYKRLKERFKKGGMAGANAYAKNFNNG